MNLEARRPVKTLAEESKQEKTRPKLREKGHRERRRGRRGELHLLNAQWLRRLDPTHCGGLDRWDVGVRERSPGGRLHFWLE